MGYHKDQYIAQIERIAAELEFRGIPPDRAYNIASQQVEDYGATPRYASSRATGTPTVSDDSSTKSNEQVAFEKRRSRLISAVNRMKRHAVNWSGADTCVREESADTAIQFLRYLPGDAILPQVAPDGEGDIMFVWDYQNGNCIVTVERHLLHLVSKPGTSDEKHIGPQQFLGFTIPTAIELRIPRKMSEQATGFEPEGRWRDSD
jgi:hypothetical protein